MSIADCQTHENDSVGRAATVTTICKQPTATNSDLFSGTKEGDTPSCTVQEFRDALARLLNGLADVSH